ncbi:hypothetical protein MGG_08346 [Pyricularia oryzae 70-15]|uniref:Uncharacterized protein n=3 Tax=Pyricularia oryzae TaxID=318829 RepID=G4MWE9_PYRO7|nr:uncharacterized protein MGG_08346 [Pyricularia oryzae 70-15]EHA55909.1 hypothetical protein MGG_08346 [Pyricularia oryzae 70-15]ELQ43515.1 hypothetical protein OOU_Y34scaffold00148g18 [Pyricularia oryzae Y34]
MPPVKGGLKPRKQGTVHGARPKQAPYSPRDSEQVAITILAILSNILFASCFHFVGNTTLKKRKYKWRDLINPKLGRKKVSQCDKVEWKPSSTIFLQEHSRDPSLVRILTHTKDMLNMVEDGDLVKIYVCLFDKKTETPNPANLVELFTLQVRYEPDMSTTVTVSWAGLTQLLPKSSVKTKNKGGLSIEEFLQHLQPIKKKVYTLIKHQFKESKRAKWGSRSKKSNFDLLVAKELLLERPECNTWTECVAVGIPARKSPAEDIDGSEEEQTVHVEVEKPTSPLETFSHGQKRRLHLFSDDKDTLRNPPAKVRIDWTEGSEGSWGIDGASDNSSVRNRRLETSPVARASQRLRFEAER